jgi:hypothetical protein
MFSEHTVDSLTIPASGHWAPTGKNERICRSCRRSFWAWDTGQERCYLCAPLDPRETQRILAAIGVSLPEELGLPLPVPAAG